MPNADEQTFTYLPLPNPTSIRLVKRDGVDESGVLKLSLIVVDLSATRKLSPYLQTGNPSPLDWPSFHCVSYTWGNPHAYGNGFQESYRARDVDYGTDSLKKMILNGRAIWIRLNLYNFLAQAPTGWTASIRNRVRKDTGRILLHDRAGSIPAIVHMYVGWGGDVNRQDNNGRSPLHEAASLGKLENVLIMLKGGASVAILDKDGQTPEDLAAQHGHFDVSDALKEAREIGSEHLTRHIPPFATETADDYIWTDAVCIDQTNLQERASQLGEEDNHTDNGLSALSKLSSAAEQFAGSDLAPYRVQSHEDYARYSVPYVSDDEWRGLAALFLRRWFRRSWVAQEAVFAKAIVMYCGTKTIHWDDLRRVSSAIFRRTIALGHDMSNVYVPIDDVACGISYYYEHLNYLREIALSLPQDSEASAPPAFKFENLVYNGFPFLATDPRDKFYALLTLATLRYGRELPILPDYSISTAVCYAKFTHIQIAEMQNLKILTSTHDVSIKQVEGLPSWVPDYSLLAAMPLRSNFERCKALEDLGSVVDDFESTNEQEFLNITGVLVDEVANVANSRVRGKRPKKFELDTSWFDLLDTIQHSSCYADQPLGEILWRTLCADSRFHGDSGDERPTPSTFAAMFKQFICAMVCSQPEISAREQEANTERAINLAGLMSAARIMQGREESGPVVPDEKFMAQVRAEMPAVERTLDSRHFDSVREVLPRLQAIREAGNELSIPSMDEIAEYFASGARPLRLSSGEVYLIPGCEPFLNAHSHAYDGGRRLFTTKAGYLGLGPASIEPGDELWLVRGFSEEIMALRPILLETSPSDSVVDEAEIDGEGARRRTFVGEAYVHRIADDNGLEEISEERLRTIVLE